jgi:O-antigen ligase
MNEDAPFGLSDRIFRIGITALLVFAPLAFASVEPWSEAVLTVGISLLVLFWIVRELRYPEESAAYRRRTTFEKRPAAGLHWPALAFLVFVVFQMLPLGESVISAISPAAHKITTLAGTPDVVHSISLVRGRTLSTLSFMIVMAFFFILVLNTLRTRRDIRRLALTVIVIGFAVALFGILQRFAWTGKIYGFMPVTTNPFGPYVNKNHFAGLMTMLVPLGLGYLLSIDKRRRSKSGRRQDGSTEPRPAAGDFRSHQFLVGFMVAIMIGALFLSLSRGGMVTLVLALLLMGGLIATQQKEKSRVLIWGGTSLAGLAAAFWLGGEELIDRIGTFFSFGADKSAAARLDIWSDSVAMVRDFPVFGSGLGTFGDVYPVYRTLEEKFHYTHAHSDHLQFLIEAGLIGTGIALAATVLFVRGLRATLRARRDREVIYLALGSLSGLVALLFHSFTTFNFHIPANVLYFTLLAAFTLKITHSRL